MITTLNNSLKMPMLGLGVFKMNDEQITQDAVITALREGYRSIDTAAIYQNEEFVGRGIKESGVKREEIFLTTKVWNEDQRNDRVLQAFEESLKRLQVDYVDLYLIHWPVKDRYVHTWKYLEKIYNDGLAKSIGVSNFNIHHLEDIKKASTIIPAINQIELHPYLTQKELLNYCEKENIKIESWSPLGASKTDLLQNKVISEIASKYNKTTAQVILRWNIDCGIITIPKSINPSRIKENFDIFDFKLTKEEVATVDNLNKNERIGPDPETFEF